MMVMEADPHDRHADPLGLTGAAVKGFGANVLTCSSATRTKLRSSGVPGERREISPAAGRLRESEHG
jgi:hypothetical protein